MWERLHLFHAMLTLTLKSPAVQFKTSVNLKRIPFELKNPLKHEDQSCLACLFLLGFHPGNVAHRT